MRLKDPLQGIKMMQLHFLDHAVFCGVMTFVVSKENKDAAFLDEFEEQLAAFSLLQWGHLLVALA